MKTVFSTLMMKNVLMNGDSVVGVTIWTKGVSATVTLPHKTINSKVTIKMLDAINDHPEVLASLAPAPLDVMWSRG